MKYVANIIRDFRPRSHSIGAEIVRQKMGRHNTRFALALMLSPKPHALRTLQTIKHHGLRPAYNRWPGLIFGPHISCKRLVIADVRAADQFVHVWTRLVYGLWAQINLCVFGIRDVWAAGYLYVPVGRRSFHSMTSMTPTCLVCGQRWICI